MTFDRDSPKVSLTCVFDERQFDCGTAFLSTANPALVVGDKVGLLMVVEMINMISVADEMEIRVFLYKYYEYYPDLDLLIAVVIIINIVLGGDLTFGRCTPRWGWPGAGGRAGRSAGWSSSWSTRSPCLQNQGRSWLPCQLGKPE